MGNNEEEFEKLLNFIDSLSSVSLSDIPEIDLYMDQVTTFIDDKLKSYKRSSNDKILTKTMINNYTKARLLPPPNRKKYSKQHMILFILIYHFKSVLSINDISTLFNSINITEDFQDPDSQIIKKLYGEFIEFQKNEINNLSDELSSNELLKNNDKMEMISTILKHIIKAETEKILAEQLIDKFLTTKKL